MNNKLQKIKEKLVSNAKEDLNVLNSFVKETGSGSYRDFLKSASEGKCRICKKPLDIVYVEETDNFFAYKFACGHGYKGIRLKDNFTLRDSFKFRKSPGGVKKFIVENIQGWFPSNRKDLSPEGVTKKRVVDRENDYYKEEVVDVKTGRIIRSIEEKLSEHKK